MITCASEEGSVEFSGVLDSPGRPSVRELTLTAPKTTPFTPEQRAQFVALLPDMIINYRQEQHLERVRAAAAQTPARQPEEAPGHSPAQ